MMESIQILGNDKVSVSFKEVLGLLCDLSELAGRLQEALRLEVTRFGDDGVIANSDPIPLDTDAELKLYRFDVTINHGDIPLTGHLESWHRVPGSKNDFVFSMSAQMTVDEMYACGIDLAGRTHVHLSDSTQLLVWFECHTGTRRRKNFDAVVVRYTHDRL